MKMSRTAIAAVVLSLFAVVAGGQASPVDGKNLEVVAVYYPHWHQYPKGTEWWGDLWNQGEWAYVKDPVKRFPGHINFRPWVGYLDGSKPEDVETEIALAYNAGIDVFLYDYYWYDGEITMQESLENAFLKARNRDRMKFGLMWCYHDRMKANRRRGKKECLMRLARTPEDFLALIEYSISHYFNKPEYWRRNGKLFFSIYDASKMIKDFGEDGTAKALSEARTRVRASGLGEVEFNAQNLNRVEEVKAAERCGFDSHTHYGYNTYSLPKVRENYSKGERLFDFAEVDGPLQEMWRQMREASSMPFIPVVPTGWDPSLRCDKNEPFPWSGVEQDYPYSAIFTNTTDSVFEKLLQDAKDSALADPKKPGAVYINAWNEYTEGCWLLPSDRRNDLRLRAVARVFGRRPAKEYVYTTGLRTWEGPNAPNGELRRTVTPDIENAKYGSHERQGIDVWFPTNAVGKVPAVVVIHGGGWSYGDRLATGADWLGRCRKAGFALVTVGYRFIQDGQDEGLVPPVRAPLDDALDAIRYIRAHADEWNIDVTRLGLTGGSAGACSSLYVALQNDCEFGIRAVFAESPQTSLDPVETREWIPNATYGAWAFGYGSFDKWIEHRAECLSWIEKFSPSGLLRACTAAKAPAFLYSCGASLKPGELAKDPTHSSVFCDRFREIAERKGVICRRGTDDEFVRMLGRDGAAFVADDANMAVRPIGVNQTQRNMPFAPLGAEQRGSDLKDVRLKGFPGGKMMRFLERRMLNAQDRQDIFDEARRAFRDRDDDDKLVLDGHRVGGYWRGEFWGKQMLSLARVTDYLGDDRLRREVADECHRLMAYQDADGYLGSYGEKDNVRIPQELRVKMKEAYGWNTVWNVWNRKYTIWGMLAAYRVTGDRAILDSVVRQANQLVDTMGRLKISFAETGQPEKVGLPSMSILKPMLLLYRETKDIRYLDCARGIVKDWCRTDGRCPNLLANAGRSDPLWSWYANPNKWAKSYEMMSCLDGLLEYARVTGDEAVLASVRKVVSNLEASELNPLGDVGYVDMFFDARHQPNACTEVCDAVHWIRLNLDLYRLTGDSHYCDAAEVAYLNAFLSGVYRDGSWTAFAVRGAAHHESDRQCGYTLNHCCVNNAARTWMDMAETTVTVGTNGVYHVNFYQDATVRLDGITFGIAGNYPVSNIVHVSVSRDVPVEFRRPSWCRDLKVARTADGYDLTFDMNDRLVDCPERNDLRSQTEWHFNRYCVTEKSSDDAVVTSFRRRPAAVLMHGPLLLAKSRRTGSTDAELTGRSTVRGQGCAVRLHPVPCAGVWGAWDVTLKRPDGATVETRVCDFQSAGDTCGEDGTAQFTIWF